MVPPEEFKKKNSYVILSTFTNIAYSLLLVRTVRNQAYSDAFELRVSGGGAGGGGVILECLGGREGGGA